MVYSDSFRAGKCSGNLARVQNKPWLVSLLAFDLLPWRQSRMKLAKTLQMGQTPWWVKWTHLEACTQISRKETWSTLFQIKLTCKQLKQPKQKRTSWLRGRCTAPSLHIACLCMHGLSLTDTQNRFWPVSYDTDWLSITIYVITHYQPTNWLPWSSLAGPDLYVSHYVFHFL